MADEPLGDLVARLSGRRLVQPDARSCGAAVLVVARALQERDPVSLDDPTVFAREVLAVHRRVTSAVDSRGRAQLPWPRALGTPPWAVARQLTSDTGVPHRTQLLRFRRTEAFDHLAAATDAGPSPFYVGTRLLPRHVVLAVAADADRLACYEPSTGRVVGVDREAFAAGRLALGGWDVVWFSVPRAGRRTPA